MRSATPGPIAPRSIGTPRRWSGPSGSACATGPTGRSKTSSPSSTGRPSSTPGKSGAFSRSCWTIPGAAWRPGSFTTPPPHIDLIVRTVRCARGRAGVWPARSVGDDVRVFDEQGGLLADFHYLRQQAARDAGRPNLCLADFIAPDRPDYIGAFAVTGGIGAAALAERYARAHDDYNAILVKALADRLAEALAELLHRRAREWWGYGRGEGLTHDDLIAEKYRGIRPAPGYPACPDHAEKRTLWSLMEVERRVGMTLTESCMMLPAASVSGWYFAHPQAKYFDVGPIGRDQLEDYARRKGWTPAEAARWLGHEFD